MNETRGLWRGKRVDNGEWVEGYLRKAIDFYIKVQYSIITELNEHFIVDPSTLGECTSLHDKKGKLIFEGDILKRLNTKQTIIYTVDWCEECAMFVVPCITHEQLESDFTVFDGDDFEVIGNIYDNPDLLTPNKS